MDETPIDKMAARPGYRTTECWLAVVVVLTCSAAVLIQVYQGRLDSAGAAAAMSSAIAAAGYGLARAKIKAIEP